MIEPIISACFIVLGALILGVFIGYKMGWAAAKYDSVWGLKQQFDEDESYLTTAQQDNDYPSGISV